MLMQIIRIKRFRFKNCTPFTNCISEINNTQLDNAKDIDTVMSMHNLIEYSDNYSKTSGSFWQYCKDIPAVDNNNAFVNFTANLERAGNTRIFFILEEGKETILHFSQGTVKVL